jgi:thioredoxin reductase
MSPQELLAIGREEVLKYGGEVLEGTAVAARSTAGPGAGAEPAFEVELADGRCVAARRLLVATGLSDVLPDIGGIHERWGRDVLHCPYCHGWEVRNTEIGILGTGPMSIHQALLFRQWSPNITLFLNDVLEPSDEEWEQFAARSISVVEGKVKSLVVKDDALTGVVLESGKEIPVDAAVVAPRMEARGAVLESLGIRAAGHPSGVGHHVESSGPAGATEVPGVWVAGNITDLTGQVMASAAAGNMAGAVINADLMMAETKAALESRRLQPAGSPAAGR